MSDDETTTTTTKSKSSKSNGAGPAMPQYANDMAWTTWPGAPKAAKLLGISLRKLRQLVDDGLLQSFWAPDRTLRFKHEWLEQFRTDREEIPDDEDDSDPRGAVGSDRQAAREGIPAEAIRATAELLRSAQRQNLELHDLVVKGFRAATEAQDVTIKRLLEREERYERLINDVFKAREEYFDAQLEREMVRTTHQGQQQMRKDLFEQSKNWLGELIDGVKHRYGLDEGARSKMQAAVDLMGTLHPQQIEMAIMAGFFNDEQISKLEVILGKKVARPGQEEPAQAKTNHNEKPGGEGSSPSSPGDAVADDPATAGERKGTTEP